MPKIVDHAARRLAVAEIAARLIANEGLEGTKVREIARLAQCSTSIVSHYFHSKHDLLLFAYRLRMERTVAGVLQATADGASLFDCLATILPLDEERVESWRVWLSFWGLAVSDPAFLREQRNRSREAVDLFRQTLIATGAMDDGPKTDLVAQALLGSVSGIATQALYDPEFWPPERQKEILAFEIERMVTAQVFGSRA